MEMWKCNIKGFIYQSFFLHSELTHFYLFSFFCFFNINYFSQISEKYKCNIILKSSFLFCKSYWCVDELYTKKKLPSTKIYKPNHRPKSVFLKLNQSFTWIDDSMVKLIRSLIKLHEPVYKFINFCNKGNIYKILYTYLH